MTDIKEKSYVQEPLESRISAVGNAIYDNHIHSIQVKLDLQKQFLAEMQEDVETINAIQQKATDEINAIQQRAIDVCKDRVKLIEKYLQREHAEYEKLLKTKSRKNYQDRVEQGKKNWRRFPDGMPLDILNALDKKKESKA